jgi:hypothetical protein
VKLLVAHYRDPGFTMQAVLNDLSAEQMLTSLAEDERVYCVVVYRIVNTNFPEIIERESVINQWQLEAKRLPRPNN